MVEAIQGLGPIIGTQIAQAIATHFKKRTTTDEDGDADDDTDDEGDNTHSNSRFLRSKRRVHKRTGDPKRHPPEVTKLAVH